MPDKPQEVPAGDPSSEPGLLALLAEALKAMLATLNLVAHHLAREIMPYHVTLAREVYVSGLDPNYFTSLVRSQEREFTEAPGPVGAQAASDSADVVQPGAPPLPYCLLRSRDQHMILLVQVALGDPLRRTMDAARGAYRFDGTLAAYVYLALHRVGPRYSDLL